MTVKSTEGNVAVTAKLLAVWNLSRVEVWNLGRLARTTTLTGESTEIAIELPVSRLVDRLVDPNKEFGWLVLVVYGTGGSRRSLIRYG